MQEVGRALARCGAGDVEASGVIVVDRSKLKFLLAGRSLLVKVSREHRKGRTYAVGTSYKNTICRVEVLEVVPLPDGWRLEIRRVTEDTPRLLAANPAGMRTDYVTDPLKAARGEPEALSDKQVQELTRYRAAVAHNERTAPILDLRDRLVAELDEALRTSQSRDERDKLRAARHHLRRIA